jgi:hypothetical protein
MSSYANEKHRLTAIKCAITYYHEKGGKERKQLDYYFSKYPQLDRSTFFTDDEKTDPRIQVEKIKAFHKNAKIEKWQNIFNSKTT